MMMLFHEKLDRAMSAAACSNAMLARALSVDPSLISRYRSGRRVPTKKSSIVDCISRRLAAWIVEEGKLRALAGLPGLKLSETEEDPLELAQALSTWLGSESESANALELFFSRFDAYHGGFDPIPLGEIPQPEQSLLPATELFEGVLGLRQAVVRFLMLAASREQLCTLSLYSDQDMDWMVGDPGFNLLWRSLMFHTLSRGHRIRIVHNVDRNLTEMLEAVENWLPLYMTGLIEPWYCRRTLGSRFTHSLFVIPGEALLAGCCVSRALKGAPYLFSADARYADLGAGQFEALLGCSSPLLRIFTPATAESAAVLLAEFRSRPGKLRTLSSVPPLYTMPRELFESLLQRNGCSGDARRALLVSYDELCRTFQRTLDQGGVEDVLFSESGGAFENAVEDRQFVSPFSLTDAPLAYDAEEFQLHRRAALELAGKDSRYRFREVSRRPFSCISIYSKKSGVLVQRRGASPALFLFEHPLMCEAFAAFFECLK